MMNRFKMSKIILTNQNKKNLHKKMVKFTPETLITFIMLLNAK